VLYTAIMEPLQRLENRVRQEYNAHHAGRDEWADWLAEHHVFVVADRAEALAQRFGAQVALARAGALLHDIADARMSRFSPEHEATSLDMPRQFMQEAGFAPHDIAITVDDAIRYHSCRDGQAPTSLEGQVLATADALAHLQTDFYLYAVRAKAGGSLDEIKQWARKKIERDFHAKICFPAVQEECHADYEALRRVLSH